MNAKKKKTLQISYIDFAAVIFLLLYPLRHVNQGIDFMDAGYSLGNYRFMDVMNETWKFATYLSNVLGAAFMKLPKGNTWLGMNIYTGLLTSVMAVTAYLSVSKMWHADSIKKLAIFISEVIALSLCWAPATILYHYLGYYFLSISALLLYKALTSDKKVCYIIAGVLLGLSVIARMPNVTYVALILPVWYGVYLQHKEKNNRAAFREYTRVTCYCLTGYLLGMIPLLGLISIRYGIKAYPDMIQSLFGMTNTATDYKPSSMVTAMFGEYITYSGWLVLFAVYFIMGVCFFKIKENKWIAKVWTLGKIVYTLGGLVLIRFCYGRGMFGVDYQEFFSFYKIATVFLLIVIITCINLMVSKKAIMQQKIWSAILLVLIFITPLGSNNGLYPTINNLFIVTPVFTCLIWDKITPVWKNYAVKYMVILFTLLFGMQSILFGTFYCFHDDSEKARVIIDDKNTVSTKNMRTTVDKAEALQELGGYLAENGLNEKRVLLYKNIPGIAYIYDLEPAIYTTWIDLDSNPLDRLMAELEQADTHDTMVICANTQMAEQNMSKVCREKYAYIESWMEKNHFQCTFENHAFQIYLVK